MKKKVNLNRPNISSDEINSRKNFDSVLKNSQSIPTKPLMKKPWFLSSVVVVTVAVVTTVLVMNKDKSGKDVASQTTEQQLIDTDSLELAAFYKAEEAKPCIAPPIEGLNVKYTVYKVNADKGGKFDFKTGSVLTIPKNAFVDQTGKPVKGEVELRYREFHDAVDFFLSGIPMIYDSAGVRYQFESAGMVEMLAYQDGKPVNMAPAKEITVEMASNQTGTHYNLYDLDTAQNRWACLGKDKIVAKVAPPANQHSQQNVQPKPEELPEYKVLEVKKEEAKVVKEKVIASLPKPGPEPKKPNKVNKDKFTFNIDVDPKEYPELAVYKGVLFEVGDENKNFNKSMYATTWDAATIKEGSKKGENYQLTLEKGSKKYELIVYPVFESKNFETAMKDFQGKFEKYNVALDKRKVEEKKAEEEYQAKVEKYNREQAALIAEYKRKQQEQEASYSTEEKVMRVFKMSHFGVYNSDCPSQYPKGVLCSATLENERKSKLLCYDVYLVDKQKNALFTYYKNPVTTFSFNPNSQNILWTVENGVLFYLKPEGFTGIKTGFRNIQLNKVEKKFETPEEMKAFFSI